MSRKKATILDASAMAIATWFTRPRRAPAAPTAEESPARGGMPNILLSPLLLPLQL